MNAQQKARALHQETEAARILREHLSLITEVADEQTVRDTIEGETNLHELIAAVVSDIAEDEILIAGIVSMIETLAARKSRLEARTEARKGAVLRAMEVGELKTLVTPSATLSLRAVPRGLEIRDESEIPMDYFKPVPWKLDKKQLKADLADGKEVPGASLDNGGITLSIRRT